MIPETDKAYIAGLFFDGEGSIFILPEDHKSKKKHNDMVIFRVSNSLRLSMEITMTENLL